MSTNFSIIGGDLRIIKLSEMLIFLQKQKNLILSFPI